MHSNTQVPECADDMVFRYGGEAAPPRENRCRVAASVSFIVYLIMHLAHNLLPLDCQIVADSPLIFTGRDESLKLAVSLLTHGCKGYKGADSRQYVATAASPGVGKSTFVQHLANPDNFKRIAETLDDSVYIKTGDANVSVAQYFSDSNIFLIPITITFNFNTALVGYEYADVETAVLTRIFFRFVCAIY